MGILWQDIKYGIRMLVKYPVLNLAVILVLSLGISVSVS